MPPEASETSLVGTPLQTPPKQTEPLPCPRCNSTNTKFCYYNNYSLVQPRYFCKGCRRYWTKGGTLRNIPVGGGTRKAKRCRSSNSANTTNSPSSSSTTTTSNSNVSSLTHEAEPVPVPVNTSQVLSPLVKLENVDHHYHGLSLSEKNEGFGGMLNAQGHGFGDPVLYGYGFYEMGIGFGGRGVWSYPGLSCIGGGVVNGEGMLGSGTPGCNTWQFSDGVSGGEGLGIHGESGDGFVWPGFAISAPGKHFK